MSLGMIAPSPHSTAWKSISRLGSSPHLSAMLLLTLTAVVAGADLPAAGPLETGDLPPLSRAIDPELLDAARALAQAKRDIAQGDSAAARVNLARVRSTELLSDYVELFEARLLLATGRAEEAAKAARRGGEAHEGRPVAAAFCELLGEARLAAGDEPGAREAWKLAFDRTRNANRKAALEQLIAVSHQRTGTLHAALRQTGDTPVSERTGIPPHLRSAADQLREADDLMGRGRSTAAIAAYEAALSSGLGETDARHAKLERGHALFRVRRYVEARAAFAALLPQPEARFWHARSLARTGRAQQAIAEFEAIGASDDAERATWAVYLAGTLLEDRGETDRAMAMYEQVAARDASKRGLDALWRVGWSAYGRDEFQRARDLFTRMAGRSEPLDALRPRYWAARSAEAEGDPDAAARAFTELAADFPLSYYGWRAIERLGARATMAAGATVAPGTSDVTHRDIERVELLIEADLTDFAQEELGAISGRARGLEDRKSVARLYVRTGDFHRAQRLVVDAYAESLSRGVQSGNEALWWLSWPPAYREIITEVFPEQSPIEPALVWAIMREESGYRPWITSSAGARGLLQIMPETGRHIARKQGYPNFDPDDLFTPRVNLALGTAYLDELGRRFPDRLSAAIGSYNAGPATVKRWLRAGEANRDDDAWVEDIPYKQTRSYVKRVLRSLHVYRTVYGETALLQQAPARASSGS